MCEITKSNLDRLKYSYRSHKKKNVSAGVCDEMESDLKVLGFELTCMKHIKYQCEQRRTMR